MSTRVIAAFALFAVGLSAAGCGESSSPTAKPTLEQKLAVIQTGNGVGEDTDLSAQFKTVLDDLETKCPNDDRQGLADMGVKAHELLGGDGVEEDLLVTMEAVRDSIPGTFPGKSCSEAYAAYATMRSA